MGFLDSILTPLVDRFKMKNPVAFAIIVLALMMVIFGIESALDQEVCTVDEFGVETCVDLIKDGTRSVLNGIRNVVIIVAGLLGAHTPQSQTAQKDDK